MAYDKELIFDFLGEYSDAQLEVENILSIWGDTKDTDDSSATLTSEQICDGAKILAIGDTFASITVHKKRNTN